MCNISTLMYDHVIHDDHLEIKLIVLYCIVMTLSKTNVCQLFCRSLHGSNTYGVLKSFVSPTPPGEHTFQQCIDALRGHYSNCPKPLVIVERFRFMRRLQLEGETIQLYNAELKHLSSTCDFGANLEERLRRPTGGGYSNRSYSSTSAG